MMLVLYRNTESLFDHVPDSVNDPYFNTDYSVQANRNAVGPVLEHWQGLLNMMLGLRVSTDYPSENMPDSGMEP